MSIKIKINKNQKLFILDTSVLLNSPHSLFGFEDNAVVVTTTLLEELDHIKDKKKSVSAEARAAIRMINDITADSEAEELLSGIEFETSPGVTGTFMFYNDVGIKVDKGPSLEGHYNKNDNQFIHIARHLQDTYPDNPAIIVTEDLNLRIKSKFFDVEAQYYKKDQTISDIDLLYKGFRHVEYPQGNSELTYEGKGEQLVGDKYRVSRGEFPEDIVVNEYMIFPDSSVGYVTFIDKDVIEYNLLAESEMMGISGFDVMPKDIEQSIVMHQLLREDLDLNIVTGPAGTGKTLLAIACAIELVESDHTNYNRIIVARTNDQMDKDIGFLKGTLDEKISPLLVGITDSLFNLVKDDKSKSGGKKMDTDQTVSYMREMFNIEFRAVNYLRGASIDDAVIIYDETQNSTVDQARGMMSRSASGSKTIILGNLRQIDNSFVSEFSNGLTRAVSVYKEYEGGSVMQMSKVVRSRLAEFTEKNY